MWSSLLSAFQPRFLPPWILKMHYSLDFPTIQYEWEFIVMQASDVVSVHVIREGAAF